MWLNEIIQPPPEPDANRWLQVTRWQVAVCEGDVCAAAILAYFFARHHGKLKHADEGREDNQIALAHALRPRRSAESLWFRATDAQIEEAIFFYKRRKFAEAIARLEALGFVRVLRKNPNPNFAADNSRYFRLSPEAVQKRLRELYDYSAAVSHSNSSSRIFADTPSEAEKGVRKNADTTGKNAESPRKNAGHNNKDIEKEVMTGEVSPSGSPSSGIESKSDSIPYVAPERKALAEILDGVRPPASEDELLNLLPVAMTLKRASQGKFAFEFWKAHRSHPRAIFDPKRARVVDDRLKAGYTLERIVLAIRGVSLSPHHAGENERGQVYDAFELILRDAKQVETFEALAALEDERERARVAEAALAAEVAPPAIPAAAKAEEVERRARVAASKLREGYTVEMLRSFFGVGTSATAKCSPADWTLILNRARELKDAEPSGGNGVAVKAEESPEWEKAARLAAESETGVRAMPYAREEDFE